MPSFRGIKVSIITHSVADELPEYPQHDGSSVQSRPLTDVGSEAINQDPARSTKVDPTISVYIPSVPGAQFRIRYVVEREPSPPGHLFFKLYMNGRHITSWGINPRIKSSGQVEKALYEPSERWNQEQNGVVFKPEGIEARYFHFVSGQETSVAEDGGLIEVRAFRANGRKRRAARLDEYRHQEKYGITSPSGGLIDNPQDVTFFDFHLIDPKDSPFVTFRFHYRLWKNLRQLNLIPSDEPSIFESSDTSSIDKGSEGALENENNTTSQTQDSSVEPQSFAVNPDPDDSVFDDSISSAEQSELKEPKSRPRRNSSYILRTPPQLQPQSATSNNVPQPSKTLRDAVPPGFPESYLHRPLPDRPLPDLPTAGPDTSSRGCRSRTLSNCSAAPSIAPSLMSYVEDVSTLNETVEYGKALEVAISSEHPGVPMDRNKTLKSPSKTSLSDSESPPLAEERPDENNPQLLFPGKYPASTGSMLESHTAPLDSTQPPPPEPTDEPKKAGGLVPKHDLRDREDMDIDFSQFPHLQLSESEWLRQTPSPQIAPRRILSPRLGRLWNTLRRNKSRSPMRGIQNNTGLRNHSTPDLINAEVKERHGNWI